MAHLIVKNRKLCIAPGSRRLVTSNGGAPCVCDGSDPGPCVGGFGDAPFIPCGFIVQLSGAQGGPTCTTPDGTRSITSLAGVNGTHVLGPGNTRPGGGYLTPCNVAYKKSYTNGNPDDVGAFKQLRHFCSVAWCAGSSSWYLTNYECALYPPSRIGDTIEGLFGVAYNVSGGDFGAPQDWYAPPQGEGRPNALSVPFCGGGTVETGSREDLWYSHSTQFSDPVVNAVGGGTITLVGVLQDCSQQGEPPRYRAVSCDGSESVWVDLDEDRDGWRAVKDSTIYQITEESSNDEPAEPVTWTTDECPAIDPNDDSNLWERCSSGGTSGFPVPFRARGPQHSGFGFGYSYQTYPDPSDSHPNCQIIFGLRYKKIPDDGGTYPSIPISPYAGPCASLPGDIASRTGCQNNGTGPVGQPVDPAGAGGGGVDPMQQVFDQQVQNFGCSGCGDPGV